MDREDSIAIIFFRWNLQLSSSVFILFYNYSLFIESENSPQLENA